LNNIQDIPALYKIIVAVILLWTVLFRLDIDFLDTNYSPITEWTMHLILDHSYLVGKLRSSKIADTKVSGF
jgi:hypothetical protein